MSSAPQDLGELPPSVIPAPQRETPDIHADAPMHGTDGDNRSVGAGEGSGNCGDMLGGGRIELAGTHNTPVYPFVLNPWLPAR